MKLNIKYNESDICLNLFYFHYECYLSYMYKYVYIIVMLLKKIGRTYKK